MDMSQGPRKLKLTINWPLTHHIFQRGKHILTLHPIPKIKTSKTLGEDMQNQPVIGSHAQGHTVLRSAPLTLSKEKWTVAQAGEDGFSFTKGERIPAFHMLALKSFVIETKKEGIRKESITVLVASSGHTSPSERAFKLQKGSFQNKTFCICQMVGGFSKAGSTERTKQKRDHTQHSMEEPVPGALFLEDKKSTVRKPVSCQHRACTSLILGADSLQGPTVGLGFSLSE